MVRYTVKPGRSADNERPRRLLFARCDSGAMMLTSGVHRRTFPLPHALAPGIPKHTLPTGIMADRAIRGDSRGPRGGLDAEGSNSFTGCAGAGSRSVRRRRRRSSGPALRAGPGQQAQRLAMPEGRLAEPRPQRWQRHRLSDRSKHNDLVLLGGRVGREVQRAPPVLQPGPQPADTVCRGRPARRRGLGGRLS